jgi:hypothetical protein
MMYILIIAFVASLSWPPFLATLAWLEVFPKLVERLLFAELATIGLEITTDARKYERRFGGAF